MPHISGKTKLAGVTGRPLDHSLSPAMHNAAYEDLGLDWVYVPLEVSDERALADLAAAVRVLPFVGFNVTMPYKQAMLSLCDEVSSEARAAGAVNTVSHADGWLIGHNTDGIGLLESLRVDAGFDPAGKRVVLLGAGGAARGALAVLLLAGCESVTVVNRDMSRAEALIDDMASWIGSAAVDAAELGDAAEQVADAHLVINATPLGMRPDDASPVPIEWLHAGSVVLDMVYGTPRQTALVEGARSRGAIAVDGLGMLVHQGAAAIDIWNAAAEGPRASRDVMRRAAEDALAVRFQPEPRG
ncbi:MAG: shikimate dehydrogenase [Coriobacteriia bacterium]|nr:shikimate dehydrogenase [Coriobacteriia bacterium]